MKFKKIIPLLLSACLVGSVFVGCDAPGNSTGGGDDNNNNPPVVDTVTVNSITVSGDKQVEVGKSITLTATVAADGEYTGEITWSITDKGIYASIEANGNTCTLTGVSLGETKVIARAGGKASNLFKVTTIERQPDPDASAALPADKKIYVVGDSTVCSFNDNYYLPRYGYGTQLSQYLNVTDGQVVNYALSGRSSKSFITESNYTSLTTSISAGDYLIIGFGHNDEKSDDKDRYTNPTGGVEDTSSFKYYLNHYYIEVAKAAGATPILCTPIVRYSNTADYSGAKAHITADGNYPAAIKALGEETGTTVIDLTALTKAEYLADNDAAQYYHAHTTYKLDADGTTKIAEGRDDTHINKYGAKMVAYTFAQALASTDCALKAHVKTNSVKPTKDAELEGAVKADYVKPDYVPFEPAMASTVWTGITSAGWYGSVLGDMGGQEKINTDNYRVEEKSGAFTVGNISATVAGKFSSSTDGFACVFMQISASKNFTATATVKVDSINDGATNQSGFGMMLRDDILVDTFQNSLSSNYVAAGLIHKKGTIFSREATKLTLGTATGADIAADSTYQLKIERIGQVVKVTVGDSTKEFTDFDFFARDKDNVYLCLFANRGIVATFTNVSVQITGDSQGA